MGLYPRQLCCPLPGSSESCTETESCGATEIPSFDNIISAGKQCRRHFETVKVCSYLESSVFADMPASTLRAMSCREQVQQTTSLLGCWPLGFIEFLA